MCRQSSRRGVEQSHVVLSLVRLIEERWRNLDQIAVQYGRIAWQVIEQEEPAIERLRDRFDQELGKLRLLLLEIAEELGEETQPIASRWTIQFQTLLRKLPHVVHHEFPQLDAREPVPESVKSNAESLRVARMLVLDKVLELEALLESEPDLSTPTRQLKEGAWFDRVTNGDLTANAVRQRFKMRDRLHPPFAIQEAKGRPWRYDTALVIEQYPEHADVIRRAVGTT